MIRSGDAVERRKPGPMGRALRRSAEPLRRDPPLLGPRQPREIERGVLRSTVSPTTAPPTASRSGTRRPTGRCGSSCSTTRSRTTRATSELAPRRPSSPRRPSPGFDHPTARPSRSRVPPTHVRDIERPYAEHAVHLERGLRCSIQHHLNVDISGHCTVTSRRRRSRWHRGVEQEP